jgi:cyanate permease
VDVENNTSLNHNKSSSQKLLWWEHPGVLHLITWQPLYDSKTTIFILSPTNSPGEGLSLSKRQGNVIFSYKFWQSQTVIVYYIVNTIM